MEEDLESTLDSVDQAEDLVLREAREMGFDEDEQHHIGISLRECLVNAVVHGNKYNSHKKVKLVVSGRGVMMIQAFMDEFHVRRREPVGTEVRMVKYLPKPK